MHPTIPNRNFISQPSLAAAEVPNKPKPSINVKKVASTVATLAICATYMTRKTETRGLYFSPFSERSNMNDDLMGRKTDFKAKMIIVLMGMNLTMLTTIIGYVKLKKLARSLFPFPLN